MTILCHRDDLPEPGAKGFHVGSLSLFAIRHDGQIYVYRNSCPHLGVELNSLEDQFLDSDGALIQCATHGALFLIENGACIAGPCSGQKLQAVPHQLIDGQITIDDKLLAPD